MSRSYRKPYFTETRKRWAKRKASKAVRRRKDLSDGASYKKVYESWNITDFRYECPYEKKLHRK
jgi:hypothetical protein